MLNPTNTFETSLSSEYKEAMKFTKVPRNNLNETNLWNDHILLMPSFAFYINC